MPAEKKKLKKVSSVTKKTKFLAINIELYLESNT